MNPKINSIDLTISGRYAGTSLLLSSADQTVGESKLIVVLLEAKADASAIHSSQNQVFMFRENPAASEL